ncbi:hypothetical protein ACTT2I_03505 [Stenotrophomonas sp. PUT21]|uniref:hypothetical protein n=1 Tax=Stenotrophomonas TaxID=40323 RepID=UPI003B8087A9
MRLTDQELKHVVNVDWGMRFWRWFRWVLLVILAVAATGDYTGLMKQAPNAWLIAGAVYLLVAWPGLCRAYVYRSLRRMIEADPEAREQLRQAMHRWR